MPICTLQFHHRLKYIFPVFFLILTVSSRMNQQTYGSYPYYPVYPNSGYPGAAAGPSSNYPPFYGPLQPQPAPQNPNPPIAAPYDFNPAAYKPNKNGRRRPKSSRNKPEMQMPVPQPSHRPRVPSNPQNPMLDETSAEKTDNPCNCIISFQSKVY
jgi:hypothetical protein